MCSNVFFINTKPQSDLKNGAASITSSLYKESKTTQTSCSRLTEYCFQYNGLHKFSTDSEENLLDLIPVTKV
jgi:hypothetical protein